MEANKLVYISHGWSLGFFERPLIDNRHGQIKAWKHGPVVVSLYHELKHFGEEKVNIEKYTEYKKDRDSEEYMKNNIRSPLVDMIKNKSDDNESPLSLLRWIYNHYGDWEAWELRAATHQKGTPWYKCRYTNGLNSHISDDIIQGYYKSRI